MSTHSYDRLLRSFPNAHSNLITLASTLLLNKVIYEKYKKPVEIFHIIPVFKFGKGGMCINLKEIPREIKCFACLAKKNSSPPRSTSELELTSYESGRDGK
jgi:hypothetical protein